MAHLSMPGLPRLTALEAEARRPQTQRISPAVPHFGDPARDLSECTGSIRLYRHHMHYPLALRFQCPQQSNNQARPDGPSYCREA